MPRAAGLLLLLLIGAPAGAQLDPYALRPLPARFWDREAAAHLLRRTAFGATPAEIDKVHAMGLEAAVAYVVNYDTIDYRPAPPPVPDELFERADRAELRALAPEEREKRAQRLRELHRVTFEEVRLWWLERLIESPRPLEETMTLFWHGLFTSGMREVRNAVYMKEQNELFRENALGGFRAMLRKVSRDRAMLVYLDGARNHKREPNENYARELLELFTLGVGNYTERDIKAAARAFTGWGFDDDGFRFRPRDHDDGVKTFLGRTGKIGGDEVIDIILQQPGCSRFLAARLLEFFLRPDPDRRTIEGLASELRRRDFEIRPALTLLLKSEAFYHPANRGVLVKSPVTLLVGAYRSLDAPVSDLRLAERALTSMGQELMQPPNVKGWAGGAAWINTATLFTRYNTLTALLDDEPNRSAPRRAPTMEDPPVMVKLTAITAREIIPPRSRRNPTPIRPRDVTRLLDNPASASQAVDFYIRLLLAVELSESKREQLIAYVENGSRRFNLNRDHDRERVRMMVRLLCSTPEFQLY